MWPNKLDIKGNQNIQTKEDSEARHSDKIGFWAAIVHSNAAGALIIETGLETYTRELFVCFLFSQGQSDWAKAEEYSPLLYFRTELIKYS